MVITYVVRFSDGSVEVVEWADQKDFSTLVVPLAPDNFLGGIVEVSTKDGRKQTFRLSESTLDPAWAKWKIERIN